VNGEVIARKKKTLAWPGKLATSVHRRPLYINLYETAGIESGFAQNIIKRADTTFYNTRLFDYITANTGAGETTRKDLHRWARKI
jgi:hypothetical protein